ncbi:hypothetical protein ACXIT0_10720 [Methylorubrum extorquens]|uniref:hypothetical protein n=1 Tax=Methylorubrum sp. GM97 TaxID=2938232 RepID=UPI0021C3D258|nr:hypothetical protein [Methylorubrum sp. GM97]
MDQQPAALGQERLHLDLTPLALLHDAPDIVQPLREEVKAALQVRRREMKQDEWLVTIRAQDDARAPAWMTAGTLGSGADEHRAGDRVLGPRAQAEVAAHPLAMCLLDRQGKADREVRQTVERSRIGVFHEPELAHQDQGIRNEGEQRGEIGLRPRLADDTAARCRLCSGRG